MPAKSKKTKTTGKTTKPDRLEASNGDDGDQPSLDTGHSRPSEPDTGQNQDSETLVSDDQRSSVDDNGPVRRQSSMQTVPDSTIGVEPQESSDDDVPDIVRVDDSDDDGGSKTPLATRLRRQEDETGMSPARRVPSPLAIGQPWNTSPWTTLPPQPLGTNYKYNWAPNAETIKAYRAWVPEYDRASVDGLYVNETPSREDKPGGPSLNYPSLRNKAVPNVAMSSQLPTDKVGVDDENNVPEDVAMEASRLINEGVYNNTDNNVVGEPMDIDDDAVDQAMKKIDHHIEDTIELIAKTNKTVDSHLFESHKMIKARNQLLEEAQAAVEVINASRKDLNEHRARLESQRGDLYQIVRAIKSRLGNKVIVRNERESAEPAERESTAR